MFIVKFYRLKIRSMMNTVNMELEIYLRINN